MRESVKTRVVDIKSFHVRIAFVWNVYGYLCVIACAFRWGVTLVGKFNYWALVTPSWEKQFQVPEVYRGMKLIPELCRDREFSVAIGFSKFSTAIENP